MTVTYNYGTEWSVQITTISLGFDLITENIYLLWSYRSDMTMDMVLDFIEPSLV